ncbi:hypothetical protein V493_04325, partial [Pseudogymnoascus sp. VKM F-4281 (FW-2241)]
PAPPPASLSERPPRDPDSDSSDDDYGPSLPPAPGSAAAAAEASAIRAREAARASAATAAASSAPKRDEWMLVPPSSGDWTSRVDPTKLKTRKFASGKGAKAPGEKSGVSAIWTETPEEKRQRLEDEVLGRKEVATNSGKGRAEMREGDEEEQAAIAKRIREYNERMRGKSLVEEHTGRNGGKEEEDDPSKRGFDKEKDMGLGGRIGHVQKQDMLRRAGDFGQRIHGYIIAMNDLPIVAGDPQSAPAPPSTTSPDNGPVLRNVDNRKTDSARHAGAEDDRSPGSAGNEAAGQIGEEVGANARRRHLSSTPLCTALFSPPPLLDATYSHLSIALSLVNSAP